MRQRIHWLSPQQRPRGLNAAETLRAQWLLRAAIIMEDEDEADDVDILWAYLGVRFFSSVFSPPKTLLYPRRNFDHFDDLSCYEKFRFKKPDLPRILVALHIPATITTASRCRFSDQEALMILLHRLSYPGRLEQLEDTYGRPRSHLSEVINTLSKFLLDKHGHLLEQLDLRWGTHLGAYSSVIMSKANDDCVRGVFCFVDGTVRACCHPGGHDNMQRELYTGHYKVHALRFLGMTLPNGIICFLHGPTAARRHDSFALRQSGLADSIRLLVGEEHVGQYFALGDSAFALTDVMKRMYKGNLPPELQAENAVMSRVRVAVEWSFEKVVQEFAFLDFDKNLKLYLSPIALWYKIGVLMTNCHTCLYGSQTGLFFQLQAPSLEWYLGEQ
jgi:hypothetical protein